MKTFVTTTAPRSEPAFREFLQRELSQRCSRNAKYSLRAFARDLGTDHSTLSQILRGKRTLTATLIRRFGRKLELAPERIERFVELAGSAPREEHGTNELATVRELTQDAAEVLADWYHHAILELVRLDGFQPDSRWIARVLGITHDEVNLALQRLLRLGLLEMASETRWIDRSGDVALDLGSFQRTTVERLAAQVRKLSLDALGRGGKVRDHSSTLIAIDSRRAPEVIERIARFRAELLGSLERGAQRDALFQLEISFFPTTNLPRREDTPWADR